MKTIAKALPCAVMAWAAGTVCAQGAIGNGVPQPKSKPPTLDECKARPAKADGATRTAADKRMDKTCARVIKKAEKADAKK